MKQLLGAFILLTGLSVLATDVQSLNAKYAASCTLGGRAAESYTLNIISGSVSKEVQLFKGEEAQRNQAFIGVFYNSTKSWAQKKDNEDWFGSTNYKYESEITTNSIRYEAKADRRTTDKVEIKFSASDLKAGTARFETYWQPKNTVYNCSISKMAEATEAKAQDAGPAISELIQ